MKNKIHEIVEKTHRYANNEFLSQSNAQPRGSLGSKLHSHTRGWSGESLLIFFSPWNLKSVFIMISQSPFVI